MNTICKIFLLVIAVAITACGQSDNKGKKFAPTEKQSTLADSVRKAAIAQLKATLGVPFDSLLAFDGVKFSVLPPATGNGVTQDASERLAMKMINIAAQNGVGGLSVNPVLGLVTKVDRMESSATNSAPQKTVVKYELTFYCGNFISNEIYASAMATVTGVGPDVETATTHAFGALKDTPALKEMFRKASQRAISWYNNKSNLSVIVDRAVNERNYALAMALLSSVPSQASTHEYAVQRNAEVSNLFFQSKANELYSQMKAAIAATLSEGTYNPEAGALYSLIPHNSKIWPMADKVFSEYCKSIDSDRRDALARARAVEDRDARNAHLLEMEKLMVEKVRASYEAQTTLAQINADARVGVAEAKAVGKKNANTGGFLGLGKLWDGGINFGNRLLDKLDD